MSDYHINIFFQRGGRRVYRGHSRPRSLPAFGRTPEEALAELQQAKAAWLAAARDAGKPIPPPRYRPAIYHVMR